MIVIARPRDADVSVQQKWSARHIRNKDFLGVIIKTGKSVALLNTQITLL